MSKLRAILVRRWPVLVVAIILGAIGGSLSSHFTSKTSKPSWIAEQVVVSNRDSSGTPADVEQDSLKVTRGEAPRLAAKALGVKNISGLVSEITSTFDANSGSIKISSVDKDPKVASKRVGAFTKAFLTVINAQLQSNEQRQLVVLKGRVTQAKQALAQFDQANPDISRSDIVLPQTQANNQLVAQRRDLSDAVATAQGQYDQATLQANSTQPYSSLGPEAPTVQDNLLPGVPKSPVFRAGLVGLLGLVLGLGLVMIVERMNPRIDTREELAEVFPYPIIAEIGYLRKKRMSFHQSGEIRLDGVWAEHYRRIRSAIQFVQARGTALAAVGASGASGTAPIGGVNGTAPSANGSKGATPNGSNGSAAAPAPRPRTQPRVFLVTSTLPGEGKSTSVALTALALAEAGVDTLVINGDFRKPRVDALLGAATSPTLQDRAELSLDRPSIDEIVQASHNPHLWIAAGGPPTFEVGARLGVAREVAMEAASRGATVLIDSAPLRVANDPIDLFPVVDALILVIRSGRSTQKSLADTLQLLELHSAPILGAVLVGTQGSREMYAYYDSYYSSVEPGSHDSQEPGTRIPSRPDESPVTQPAT